MARSDPSTARTANTPELEAIQIYLRDLKRYPLLSREEEYDLAVRARDGDAAARERLIVSNLRFVINVAKRYVGQGLSIEDLINAGNVGLIKAARRFDPSRGFKFITYAVWWIRQAILQALGEQSRVVRLPMNRVAEAATVSRASKQLEQTLGRRATVDEIAREVGLAPSAIMAVLASDTHHVSLDDTGSSDDRDLIDTLPDDRVVSPEDSVHDVQVGQGLRQALRTLPKRECQIMLWYYGLEGSPQTLEEIGNRLGLTRERIRQLKNQALDRLRHSTRARALMELYEH